MTHANHNDRCEFTETTGTWPYVKRCKNTKISGSDHCPEHNIRRKFLLVIYHDRSIAIETTSGRITTFFANETAEEIIKNLEDLGEL